MLFQTAVLLSVLVLAASFSCPNRLYRGQRLNASQYLCSRNPNYRLLFNNTGQVQINEAFLSNTSFKPPPLTLFSTNASSPSPSHVTFTDAGDFVAVSMDGSVYWQANVTGADFLELQDTGIAVLFAKNASTIRVLWKSPSTYSLRIVGGTSPSAGRLEFFFNNTWGSVSSYNAANNFYADVACRTLGFDTGVVTTNTFGQSTGPVWMDNVKCTGRETVFQECSFGDALATATGGPTNWWGRVSLYSTHSNDVAISCQGTSSLGVLPPTGHVCNDRLYVGQTLALGESLCAGPNGEYTLRFSNKRQDTVVELWYKTERKWSIGKTNAMPAGAAVRLDADGVMRIVGSGAGLPFNLFSNSTANASFVELQDNGVVRVVSASGSTGWRKAPDDVCYTEKRKIMSYTDIKYLSTTTGSPLTCLAACDSDSTCKMVDYNEAQGFCKLLRAYPWDASASGIYYEKTAGCSSGSSCYQSYPYDRWGGEPYLSYSYTVATGSVCTSLCDATATCVSAYYNPSGLTCYVSWKRLNETVDNVEWTTYYRKIPCTAVDPSQVALLPVKACPTKLLPGSFLLSQQYLCSPNGQHVLTVEKTGRLLIDGGQWTSNSATNSSGYLQYTTTNQLFLRLDDKSLVWKADSMSSPAGYLALSDAGKLQMFDVSGAVIWDHENGFRSLAPLEDYNRLVAMNLVDGNPNTCVGGRNSAMLSYQLGQMALNQTFNLTLVGQNLRCGSVPSVGNYLFAMSHLTTSNTGTPQSGEERNCRLISDASQSCRFACVCQSVSCEILTLWYVGCGNPDGSVCEVIMQF